MEESLNKSLLEESASAIQEKTDLSPLVAVSERVKDYDNKCVVFSFEYYNSTQCEIHNLAKPEARKFTKELKKISLVQTKHFRHESSSNIACKPVGNSGPYAVLFNELPEDAELLEIDYTGPGRIFGFIVQNIFNVVTVAKKHK